MRKEGEVGMKAVIRLDVPEWQIGQEVTVFFKDTMEKNGICDAEQPQIVRCKDCKNQYYDMKDGRIVCGRIDNGEIHSSDWFCADGEMME